MTRSIPILKKEINRLQEEKQKFANSYIPIEKSINDKINADIDVLINQLKHDIEILTKHHTGNRDAD
jgi:hypothetical protein